MKCEHITSLGKYQFFFSYLFIHWHLYLLSTSLLNVNIATYYTNSLSYGYNLQFSPVKFVISGFEFGNVTIRHWLLWDRWHSCPNNCIVRSRCAKMFIENIPESIGTCKLLHILRIIFTMLFFKHFLINNTSMYICIFCLVREFTCSFFKYSNILQFLSKA